MERVIIGGLECDLFGRENGAEAPVVFFLHGLTQSKQFSEKYCESLAENGCVAIGLELRNHGERTVDSSLNQKTNPNYLRDTYGVYTGTACDISHIIDFLPAVLGFVPEKIGVMGFSLGAHCALVARVVDQRIDFVVPICGATDRKSMLKSRFIQKGGSEAEFECGLPLGMDELFKKYDPIHNLGKLRGCEVFMISGDADYVVPATTNENLLQAYKDRFGSTEGLSLKIYPDAKHQITEEMWGDVVALGARC